MRAALVALGLLAASAAQGQAVPAPAAQERPPVQKIRASKIILVGDSTMQSNSGWGGSFCAYRVSSFVACVNLARGGRSTYNYRAEGSWDLALAEMRTPGFAKTWVLIQFGHNDQPGKPGRSTDLATEFLANLRRYVEDVRAAGAIPVLVTPLTRRMFVDGRLEADLAPWAVAIRRVAGEMNVPLLDLYADSAAAVQAMGEAEADRFAQLPKGTQPTPPAASTEVQVQPFASAKLSFDRTHLGARGADYFSAMVVDELAAAIPELKGSLIR